MVLTELETTMSIIICNHTMLHSDEASRCWGQLPSAEELELTDEEAAIYEAFVKENFWYTQLEDEVEMLKECIFSSDFYQIINDRQDLVDFVDNCYQINENHSYDELEDMNEHDLLEIIRSETNLRISFQYDDKYVISELVVENNSAISELELLVDVIDFDEFNCNELPYFEVKGLDLGTRTLTIIPKPEWHDYEAEFE